MIAVVGGGISGLALGLELRSRGIAYRIFEADHEPGGVIRTHSVHGHRIDLGPQRLRLSPEISKALGEGAGWAWEEPGAAQGPEADRVFIARHGKLHPVPKSFREALSTQVVSVRGKLRMALEPIRGHPRSEPSPSAGAYLRHRVGEEGYRALIGPLFGGLYGSDPDAMEAERILLPALKEIGADRSLLRLLIGKRAGRGAGATLPMVPRGGMQALPIALAEMQREFVRLGTPVHRITPSGRAGYVLDTAEGELEAEAVVLTTPPPQAGNLLRAFAPESAAAIEGLTLNSILLVHMALEPLPLGLGFQVAFGEEGRVRGVTFSGNLNSSGRTAVAFLGGMRDPGAVELGEDELKAIAEEEVTGWTGSRVSAFHVSRTSMPAWDRSWEALDGLRLPDGIHLLTNYTGRPGIIGRFREAAKLAGRLRG